MSARNAQNAPCHIVATKGNVGDRNTFFGQDAAPSMTFLGSGLQDHRLPWDMYNGPAGTAGVGILGWYGDEPVVINAVPATASLVNIAAAAAVANGVPMALAGGGAGATLINAAAPAFVLPGFILNSQAKLTAGLALDGLPALIVAGQRFRQGFYDRNTFVSRAVSITGNAGSTGGNFLVKGFDVYGYPMSEVLAHAGGASTKNGRKAFKIVASVTPQFTDAGHTYSVGTTDIIGLPVFTRRWEDTLICWNGAAANTSAGFTAGDTTAPATTATGDTRGTYVLQSASDGVKRLSIQVTPSLSDMYANVPTSLTTGIFGVAQV